jgi:hypothetical protein
MIEIPDTVVSEDTEIRGPVTNTLVTCPGVSVTTLDAVSGTVRVMSGDTLPARARCLGWLTSRTGLAPCSTAKQAAQSRCVRGVRVSGSGPVKYREGSTLRPPVRTMPSGTTIYGS